MKWCISSSLCVLILFTMLLSENSGLITQWGDLMGADKEETKVYKETAHEDTCHPDNVLKRGISCFNSFYSESPQTDDWQELLDLYSQQVKSLKSCWYPVLQQCSGTLVHLISNITDVYQLVHDISVDPDTSIAMETWMMVSAGVPSCQNAVQSLTNFQILATAYSGSSTSNTMNAQYLHEYYDCMIVSLGLAIKQMSGEGDVGEIVFYMQDLRDKLQSFYTAYSGGMADIGVDISNLHTNLDYVLLLHNLQKWNIKVIKMYLMTSIANLEASMEFTNPYPNA